MERDGRFCIHHHAISFLPSPLLLVLLYYPFDTLQFIVFLLPVTFVCFLCDLCVCGKDECLKTVHVCDKRDILGM